LHSILITGGALLDGSDHRVPTPSELLVKGDRINAVGLNGPVGKAQVLDARGCMVAPGFIDVHAHSDTTVFLEPTAQCLVYEGVTTEISGTCGLSLFPIAGPCAESRRASLRRSGIDADWRDAAGYFDALDASGRPATPDEVQQMTTHLHRALDQGALGLSTGLCYAPGCFAAPDEIAALCRCLAPSGRPYCTHMRSEGRHLIESATESIAWCRESGAPLHISHVKVMGRAYWSKIDAFERLLFETRESGLDVTADRYPYTAAMTDLASVLPDRLMEGGRGRALERLGDTGALSDLAVEFERDRAQDVRWDAIRIGRASHDAELFEGRTLQQVADHLNCRPLDALFEVLRRGRMDVSAIFFDMSEENLERILQWPFVLFGSDTAARALTGPTARGKPHPRTFGTFARVLGHCVRDRKLMDLSEAVARLTSRPAKRFGLSNRGVLRKGAYADIVVFDANRIRDRATYDTPFRLSEGIRHVLVNGVPVLQDGIQLPQHRPGRVLRG